ncbi:LOW QUALITY PROTEIN: coiled-coil domain-containing protein 42-like [Taeniopygia guttata]|uniref:LOW QUALITY PROTEIN: coiled-coil domain-containing protein 42-like n=1 Tax=Taeniopygia guttata TaxID=59729 RepID=UPI003BB8A4E7
MVVVTHGKSLGKENQSVASKVAILELEGLCSDFISIYIPDVLAMEGQFHGTCSGRGWGCHAARWDLRWCWGALPHHPTRDTVQHPEKQHPAKELNSVCNLKENSCGRELTVTEDDSQSSLIQLLKKKKEARETEKAMAAKEEAFRGRMKVIADRWRDLHAKRAQLKAHVERSGRAVQKHEELRIQALKINSKQREEKMKKDGELLRVKTELETLRKKHQKLFKKVQKYSIFKKYLEDVLEVSQFEDISEVTSQYKLLVRTRKDLLQSQQGHKQLTEQDKVLLEQYKAQKEAEMLQYKTELVQLKLRFYQAQGDLPLWEAHWADIQDRTSKKTRKLWTIKLAIHNLFQSTNTRLQAEWDVLDCSSCRQLSMVEPSQKKEQQ